MVNIIPFPQLNQRKPEKNPCGLPQQNTLVIRVTISLKIRIKNVAQIFVYKTDNVYVACKSSPLAHHNTSNLLCIPQALGNTLNCTVKPLSSLVFSLQPMNCHHSHCYPPFGNLIITHSWRHVDRLLASRCTLVQHVKIPEGISHTLITSGIFICCTW